MMYSTSSILCCMDTTYDFLSHVSNQEEEIERRATEQASDSTCTHSHTRTLPACCCCWLLIIMATPPLLVLRVRAIGTVHYFLLLLIFLFRFRPQAAEILISVSCWVFFILCFWSANQILITSLSTLSPRFTSRAWRAGDKDDTCDIDQKFNPFIPINPHLITCVGGAIGWS